MSEVSRKRIGRSIQEYARSKQGGGAGTEGAPFGGAGIDPALRDRVDMLGIDCERLLEVPPERALGQLEALEREAEREDAQAKRLADRVRAAEERAIDDTENRARGDHRVRAGKYRGAGRDRRRR